MRALAPPLGLAVAVTLLWAGIAGAGAGTPTTPTAANGHPVTKVATGVSTPTAFAFTGSTIFVGSGPSQYDPGPTGLFTLADGVATPVPDTPSSIAGLAWHDGKLYVSTFSTIVALSGWDGTRFAGSETIAAPLEVAYSGIAFGPDGRLYAGTSFRDRYDPGRDPAPHAQGVISMTADGKDVRDVARGLRQPFQLTFPNGTKYPYVSVLGKDKGKIPLDAIVVAKPGSNFGYPKCEYGLGTTCKGFPRPRFLLPRHASPMGLQAVGHTLFVALYGGLGDGRPVVAALPLRGGRTRAFLKGIPAPIVGLGVNAGTLYVGDLDGEIWSVAI